MTQWPVFIAGLLLGAGAAGLAFLAARRSSLAGQTARLSRLAHDLRTPLASIAAYGEILADAADEGDGALAPADRKRFLGILNEEARRLAEMIDRHLGTKRSGAEARPPAGRTSRPATAGGTPRTVLVVDDDRFIVEATRTLLAREGFEALGAGGGEEALARARADRPDLILMDLAMPGLRGDEALRRLRSDPSTRDIPVIITTGDSEGTPPEGAAAVLTKPVDRDTLLAAIDRVAVPAPAPPPRAVRRIDE